MHTITLEIYQTDLSNYQYLRDHCTRTGEWTLVGKATIPEADWMLYAGVDYIVVDSQGELHAMLRDHSAEIRRNMFWLASLNIGDCRGEYVTYFVGELIG